MKAETTFTTPISGKLGYSSTSTSISMTTAMTSGTGLLIANMTLSVGVWTVMGQVALIITTLGIMLETTGS